MTLQIFGNFINPIDPKMDPRSKPTCRQLINICMPEFHGNYWSCVNRSYRIQPDPSTPLPSIILINIEEILVEDFRRLKKIPSREQKKSPTFSWKGKNHHLRSKVYLIFRKGIIIFGFSMISIGTSCHISSLLMSPPPR